MAPAQGETSVVLSEIHYHPAGENDDQEEFIELYNSSPISVDLSGWKLRGDADYEIPSGTRLAGGEFITIAANPSVLENAGAIGTILGPWSGNLSNNNGTVRLQKASGGIVLETNYRDDSPWPAAADGAGHSLVLKTPALGESQVTAWAKSLNVGGSPGIPEPSSGSPLDSLVISEVLINGDINNPAFVEFHNPDSNGIDLSGCQITHEGNTIYHIPNGTSIGATDYLSFSSATTGINFSQTGDRLFLIAPDGTRVIAGRKLNPQIEASSWGGLNGEWRERESPTPSLANSPPLHRDIAINEINYHPLGDQDAAEFIELHNTSTAAVDLSQWRLDDAIDFTFPSGTTLSPGGFLVIAKDRLFLLSIQPSLDPQDVLGDYSGKLSNRGETLTLLNAGGITQDEVRYFDGGRWPSPPDGGGSSLQLIDPRADNSLAPNWTSGDESSKASSITIEYTGVTEFGHQKAPNATRCFVRLEGAGEVIIDDIEVIVGGQNRVTNGSFSSGLTNWNAFGTHQPSFTENGALHLVSTDGGDDANLVESTLNSAIPPGSTVTMRATCRWVSGNPQILLGLNGGWLEVAGNLPTPSNIGTPAGANFNTGNTGPAITELRHSPILPLPGQPIEISAKIDDPDGVSTVFLRYRLDPDSSTSQVIMTPVGNGTYQATIPAQLSGAMIAFHIIALDSASPRSLTRFPDDAPSRECLIKIGESPEPGDFSTMHLWTTQAVHDEWRDRVRSSNLKLDGTFVSDGQVYYNVGLHYAGSQNGVSIYDSPTGNPSGYNIALPDDEVFLNTQRLTLDRETTRDATRQRERLLFWFLEKMELPNLHRRYVHVFLNGVERDSLIMEDVQKPNGEVLEQWFSDEGRLTKTNPWFEFDANGSVLNQGTNRTISPELQSFPYADGSLWTARDRRTWTQGAGHDDAHDFSGIRSLIEAAQAPQNQYLEAINSKASLRQWMRTFATNDLGSFWDTFGNPGRKNAYLFESLQTGKWDVVVWDMDVGLGVLNDPVNTPLFPTNIDPAIQRMYDEPSIVRNYWQALAESLDSFFLSGNGTEIDAILQETYDALIANDAAVTSPFSPSGPENLSVSDWIAQRRTFLEGQLAGIDTTFTASAPSASTEIYVTLTGRAPLATTEISANQIPLTLTWTSPTDWSAQVALQPGLNTLLVTASDASGNSTGQETLSIDYTGTETWPQLRINEWLASNPSDSTFLDPFDNQADDWIEIYNPSSAPISLDAWSLSDSSTDLFKFQIPAGFTIPANGFILIWADNEPFQNDPNLRNEIHTNFKLNADGESIILTAPDGTEIDWVHFAAQTPGLSRLRIPDGDNHFSYSLNPSPAANNTNTPPLASSSELTLTLAPNETIVRFPSNVGVIYELESSPDLSTWSPKGAPLIGHGSDFEIPIPFSLNGKQFFRIQLH